MQTALHQKFGLSGTNHGHSLCRSVMAVLGGDHGIRRDIEFLFIRNRSDFSLRSDENWLDKTAFRRLNRSYQSIFATGVRDCRGRRRKILASLEQFEKAILATQMNRRQLINGLLDLLGRCQNLRPGNQQLLLLRIDTPAVQKDSARLRPLLLDGYCRLDLSPDGQLLQEFHVNRFRNRTQAWEFGTYKCGNQ